MMSRSTESIKWSVLLKLLRIAGNSLELSKLQRKYEKRLSVNVRKLERLDNQQPSPEKGRVQRLSSLQCVEQFNTA